jgi:hypothetical protein
MLELNECSAAENGCQPSKAHATEANGLGEASSTGPSTTPRPGQGGVCEDSCGEHHSRGLVCGDARDIRVVLRASAGTVRTTGADV